MVALSYSTRSWGILENAIITQQIKRLFVYPLERNPLTSVTTVRANAEKTTVTKKQQYRKNASNEKATETKKRQKRKNNRNEENNRNEKTTGTEKPQKRKSANNRSNRNENMKVTKNDCNAKTTVTNLRQ